MNWFTKKEPKKKITPKKLLLKEMKTHLADCPNLKMIDVCKRLWDVVISLIDEVGKLKEENDVK